MQDPGSRGALIGRGRTAEVYAWGEDRALKLFNAGSPARLAEAEYQAAASISQIWAVAPAVHGLVRVHDRYGVIYERVRGPSLLRAAMARPWTFLHAAQVMAELHARMHAVPVSRLPDQAERLRQNIEAARLPSGGLRRAALAALAVQAQLGPDGALCHGDFHPDNIIWSSRGPIVLDWLDASSGHPLADVARTALLMQYAVLPPNMPRRWLIQAMRTIWYRLYLRHYCKLRSVTSQQVAAWLLPVATARLSENIPEEEKQVIALVTRLSS